MGVNATNVSIIFSFVSVSGPIFGVVFGGFVSSKFGGYNNRKSMLMTGAVGVFAVVVAVPAGFMPDSLFWI